MKKILISALLLGWLAAPASAQGKKKHYKHVKGDCPAATCTDHSHDIAYSKPNSDARTTGKTRGYKVTMKGAGCPAATCTDHSLDVAYSPEWREAVAGETRQEQDMTSVGPAATTPQRTTYFRAPLNGPYYNMGGYTVYGRSVTGVNRPSAYEGDDAPTYDGPEKNAYRNLRANNTSEPLPANNGQ